MTYEIDSYKFKQEINTFKTTVAPTDKQRNYLEESKERVRAELLKQSANGNASLERCLLTAICGTIRTKKEQAEFASRLLLLDILTE